MTMLDDLKSLEDRIIDGVTLQPEGGLAFRLHREEIRDEPEVQQMGVDQWLDAVCYRHGFVWKYNAVEGNYMFSPTHRTKNKPKEGQSEV